MKKCYLFIVFICITAFSSFASVTPGDSTLLKSKEQVLNIVMHSSVGDIEKLAGRKLTFGERVKLKVIKSKYFKSLVAEKGEPTEKQKKQGKASMILGIISVPLLFIPVIGFLAIPAAIVGLVLGIQSIKGNSNTQALVGIITSSVTLFLIILALIFVAAYSGFY